MKEYSKIKELIKDADAILIGADTGLSKSAGVNYGKEDFKKNFPELVKKYDMTDMYTSSFYSFKNEEERWSYWSKHINYLYNMPCTKAYKNLYNLVKDKEYFVITTNVDGQIIKSGFDPKRVFEVQGTLSKMQCAVGCHNTLYDDLDLVNKMMEYKEDTKVSSSLIPYCPICEGRMEINLRKDAFFVKDDNWSSKDNLYRSFVNKYKDKKLLLIELGSGLSNPDIIRFPFEKLTYSFNNINLIRINDEFADVPFEIKLKTVTIKEDCAKALEELNK